MALLWKTTAKVRNSSPASETIVWVLDAVAALHYTSAIRDMRRPIDLSHCPPYSDG